MTTEEARAYEPKVVHVGKDNQILQLGNDPAEGHTPGLCVAARAEQRSAPQLTGQSQTSTSALTRVPTSSL